MSDTGSFQGDTPIFAGGPFGWGWRRLIVHGAVKDSGLRCKRGTNESRYLFRKGYTEESGEAKRRDRKVGERMV